MVREGGEVTCEETEKVQWTGEAGEGYHQPGWFDFLIYKFGQNQAVCLFSVTNLIKNRLFVYFHLQLSSNQFVCLFSFKMVVKNQGCLSIFS